ncbi:MAG: hypothetical protein VW450_07050 [Chloroflexota bacterium]
MRKRILVAAVAASVLTVALLGSAAFAHFGGLGAGNGSNDGTYAAKVAEILGLDADTVQAAMQQAAVELRDEALQTRLDAMVEQGIITQDEADQWLTWQNAKPDVPALRAPEGHGGFGFGFGRRGGRGFGPGHAPDQDGAPAPDGASFVY